MALDLSKMPQDQTLKETKLKSEASEMKESTGETDPPPMTVKMLASEKQIPLKDLPLNQTPRSIPDIVKEAVQSENVLKESQQEVVNTNGDLSPELEPKINSAKDDELAKNSEDPVEMLTEPTEKTPSETEETLPAESNILPESCNKFGTSDTRVSPASESESEKKNNNDDEDSNNLEEEENGELLQNSIQGILDVPINDSVQPVEEARGTPEPSRDSCGSDNDEGDAVQFKETDAHRRDQGETPQNEITDPYQPPQTEAIALTKNMSPPAACDPIIIDLDVEESTPTPILKIPSYSPKSRSVEDHLQIHPCSSPAGSLPRSVPLPAHSIITTQPALSSPQLQPPPAHSSSAPMTIIRHAAPASYKPQVRPRSSVNTTHVRYHHIAPTVGSSSLPMPVGARIKTPPPAALGKPPSDSRDKQVLDDNDNTMTLEMQTSLASSKGTAQKTPKGDSDKPVGWTTLAGTIMPYIMRGNTKYVSVKMVESKLLSKYPNIDLDEMAEAGPIYSYYITDTEAKLLTEINSRCYSHAFGSEAFSMKDLIVSLRDFENFYNNVDTHFQKLEMEKAVAAAARTAKKMAQRRLSILVSSGGWLQINNTICPYVVRGGIKYVPVSVVKFAARLLIGMDITKHQIPTLDEDIQMLNSMCKSADVAFTFDINSTQLLKVEMVVRLNKLRISIKELPKMSPFDHGVYDEELEVIKEANGLPRTMLPQHARNEDQSLQTKPVQHIAPVQQVRQVQQIVPGSRTPLIRQGPPVKQIPQVQQAPPIKPGPPVQLTLLMQQASPIQKTPPLQKEENAALVQLKQMVNARAGAASVPMPTISSPQSLALSRLPPSRLPPHAHSTPQSPLPPRPQHSFTPQPITIAPLDPNQIPGAPPDHELRPPMPHHIQPQTQHGQFGFYPGPQFRPEPPLSSFPRTRPPLQRMQGPPPLRPLGGRPQSRPYMERPPPPYPAMAQGPRRPPMSYAMTRPHQLTPLPVSHQPQRPPQMHPQVARNPLPMQHQSPRPPLSHAMTRLPTKPASKSPLANEPLIKPVRLSGKTVSCILRHSVGQRYALVEALARLYFPQCTLPEFQKVLRDDLNIPLEELTTIEEQEFIKFYDLPVKSLKCKTVASISQFEAFFHHLKFIFKDKMFPTKQASPGSQRMTRTPNMSSTARSSPGIARNPKISPTVVRDSPIAHNSMPNSSDGSDSAYNQGGSRSSTPSEASGPSKRPASADSNSAGPAVKKAKTLGNVLAKLKQKQEASLAPK